MKSELLAKLKPHGQEHVLAFWDLLSEPQREQLAAQIQQIDLAQIADLVRGAGQQEDWAALAARAEPPTAIRLDTTQNPFTPDAARERGAQCFAAGKVGIMLVAGGQGTRLGFDHPKGMFAIGPVSGASLFQILVEKVLAVRRRDGRPVPLYVMTSPATHEETVAFFDEHHRFGMPAEDLRIFCQGTMPAVDVTTGKLLLASRDSVFLSPDGHGGMVAALAKHNLLDDMLSRGIEQLFYLQVDNPLAEIGDAEFVGYHLLSQSEMSTQVVAKQAPADRVGNFVSIDGAARIIEYSDLPAEAGERRNADGSLRFWAGSTALHLFEVSFLQRVLEHAERLPFHVARKKAPYVDASGVLVEPTSENALKFERFVFDLLPLAKHAIAVEVDEAKVFAPLKSASGASKDTPETVQAQIVALHRGWLEAAGAQVAAGVKVEISPLFALDAHEVRQKTKPGVRIEKATYLR